MSFFSSDYIAFFKELDANNNKEWFDANRSRYEREIKNPFKRFVEHLISKVHEIDPEFNTDSKNTMMRINRDIRFSKDKTPYKTHMAAFISSGGKKDMIKPGQFFSLGLNGMEIFGGAYQPDKTQLYNIRQHISYNLMEFEQIISEKSFKERFGQVLGEKNKVIPAEFKEDAKKQNLLFNKSFYYQCTYDSDFIIADNLDEIWIDCFKIGRAFREFLYEGAIG